MFMKEVNLNKSNTYLLLGKIVSILTLAWALMIAANTPGNGMYEVSLYNAYPPHFWGLLLLSLAIGYVIVFIELYRSQDSYRWLSGWIPILCINLLILSLPYLRDYAFIGQWDDVNHYSATATILDYRYPDIDNFYPATHLLASTTALLTGIDLQIIILTLPILLYVIFLANVATMAWVVDNRPAVRGLMVILASPLVFYTYATILRPTHVVVYMIPLLIAWVYKTRFRQSNIRDVVPFILLLIFLPFLHPWAVVAGIGLMAAFVVAFLWANKTLPAKNNKRQNIYIPILILFITWWMWFTTFTVFGTTVNRLAASIVDELGGAHSIDQLAAAAGRANLLLGQLLSLITFTYGPALIYLLPAAIIIILLLGQLIRGKRNFPLPILAFSIFILLFIGIAGVSLFRDLVTGSPHRVLNMASVTVPVLIAVPFYNLTNQESLLTHSARSYLLRSGLLISLIFAAGLGMLGTHYSSIVGQPNHQLSYAQQAGLGFFVENAAQDEQKIYSPFKGAFTLASVENSVDLKYLRATSPRWWISLAPAHFGYDETIEDEHFDNPGYLWINAFEMAYYSDVWPEGGRFTPQDFELLAQDKNWHQVYSSGDFTLWRVVEGN